MLAGIGLRVWKYRSPRQSTPLGPWITELTNKDGRRIAKSVRLDPLALSADPSKPAFLAPRPGARVYHGFPLIGETTTDGFTFGAITDFLEKDSLEGCTIGDAFVEGPDGTRAGIIWEVGDQSIVSPRSSRDQTRWGVYNFIVPKPVNSIYDLEDNFATMLPEIKKLYKRTHKP